MNTQSQYADPAGRYRLDSMIATGGMGVVWRATDTRLDREVAVKVLKAEYADDPTFRSRFETEVAGYRDAWAAGVGNGHAVVVWMGRADGAPRSAVPAGSRPTPRPGEDGRLKVLVDATNLGPYRVEARDAGTGDLLYSRGFASSRWRDASANCPWPCRIMPSMKGTMGSVGSASSASRACRTRRTWRAAPPAPSSAA